MYMKYKIVQLKVFMESSIVIIKTMLQFVMRRTWQIKMTEDIIEDFFPKPARHIEFICNHNLNSICIL